VKVGLFAVPSKVAIMVALLEAISAIVAIMGTIAVSLAALWATPGKNGSIPVCGIENPPFCKE